MDGLSYFLTSEQNMFDPTVLLEDIRIAIEKNKTSGEFWRGFNSHSIKVVNKQVLLTGYHLGGEILIDFIEFKNKIEEYYKKYPYYSGEK